MPILLKNKRLLITISIFIFILSEINSSRAAPSDAFNIRSDYREVLQDAVAPVQKKNNESKFDPASFKVRRTAYMIYYQGERRAILDAFASASQKACLVLVEPLLNVGGGSCYDINDIVDLSNKDLSNLYLDYAEFGQINFENSNFTNSSLRYTNFGCCAHNANVNKANFSNANLSFSYLLRKCNQCNFHSANLSYSKNTGWYESSDFSKADLSYADFGSSSFANAIFKDTIMDHANFSGANFSGSVFQNIQAESAIFLGVKGIQSKTIEYLKKTGAIVDKHSFAKKLRENQLNKNTKNHNPINLSYIDLSNTDLSNADLTSFDFKYTNLDNVNMSNANLENVHIIIDNPLRSLKLDGANLRGVYIPSSSEHVMKDVTIFGADLTDSNIRGNMINVQYNSKPLMIDGVVFPPTKFSFNPKDLAGLIDVSTN